MRAAARKLADGSSTGNAFICSWNCLLFRQLGRAVLATPDVLLEFVPRVVSQFAVQIQRVFCCTHSQFM